MVKANQPREDLHDVGMRRHVGRNRRVKRYGTEIPEAKDAFAIPPRITTSRR